jgi:hypothetical protein
MSDQHMVSFNVKHSTSLTTVPSVLFPDPGKKRKENEKKLFFFNGHPTCSRERPEASLEHESPSWRSIKKHKPFSIQNFDLIKKKFQYLKHLSRLNLFLLHILFQVFFPGDLDGTFLSPASSLWQPGAIH